MLTHMPNLRLDDVPDWVIETLNRRAARIGMSLLDYVQLVLSRAAAEDSPDDEGRSLDEVFAEIKENKRIDITAEEIIALIREGRDE